MLRDVAQKSVGLLVVHQMISSSSQRLTGCGVLRHADGIEVEAVVLWQC